MEGLVGVLEACREVAHIWGTKADERRLAFACDHVLPEHNLSCFRGITVDAPTPIVFAWLCQLRVAAYSYDWISNPGRRSPRQLDASLQKLEVGQRFMDIFDLAEFEQDRHLTLRLREAGLFPPLAVSYVTVAIDRGRCRLLAKLVMKVGSTLRDRLAGAAGPWLDLVMMRRQMLNLKALAEGTLARL